MDSEKKEENEKIFRSVTEHDIVIFTDAARK